MIIFFVVHSLYQFVYSKSRGLVMRGHLKGHNCVENHFWASSCLDVFIACREISVAKKLIRILEGHEKDGKIKFVDKESLADLIVGDQVNVVPGHWQGGNKRSSYYLFADKKPKGLLPLNVTVYRKEAFLREKTTFEELHEDIETCL
jgi:hypothetical protein